MFPGFTAADFDCYEPRKWRSNVYNRERLEIKQKLLGLAREVAGPLLAKDGSPLHIEASVEHPALWNHKQVESQSVYFSRNEAARKVIDAIIDRQKPISSLLDDPTPQRNHLFLAITLGQDSLEVSLKLHPDARVDRQNLERKIEDHFECERLLDLLRDLRGSFHVGVTPERRPVSAAGQTLDLAGLRGIIASLPQMGSAAPGLPGQVPVAHLFYVGRSAPRAEVLGERGQGAMAGEAVLEWTRRGLLDLLPIYHFIAWSRDNDYVSMKQVLEKERTTKRQKGLGKNDTVRITKGMLSGKSGVVQGVDTKGQLKVLVGNMMIKIDAADVKKL